jgi:hypothetical protein
LDIHTRRRKQQTLMSDLLERKIRMHAQHIYDQHGQTEGTALRDWAEAESRVLENSVLATFYRKTRAEGKSPAQSEDQQFTAAASSAISEAGA